MMTEEQLQKSLKKLAESAAEVVRPGLAEDIKGQIPSRLCPHRAGLETINIMIHLKVSKLAAAAVIIITMVLFANFFGGRDSTGGGIYEDGKMLISYFLGGDQAGEGDRLASTMYSVHQDKEVVYYGDVVDTDQSDAVLMQWRLTDGRYRVVFCDLRVETVGADELIKLQAQMLQKKTK